MGGANRKGEGKRAIGDAADILSIVATCIAHDVNPRAYLHKVVHCIVHGWPHANLRELLPDRMLFPNPKLDVDPEALLSTIRSGGFRNLPTRSAFTACARARKPVPT
jgi:hypothetical protein